MMVIMLKVEFRREPLSRQLLDQRAPRRRWQEWHILHAILSADKWFPREKILSA